MFVLEDNFLTVAQASLQAFLLKLSKIIPNSRIQISWLVTSIAEELNLRIRGKYTAKEECGTRTCRDHVSNLLTNRPRHVKPTILTAFLIILFC